jgi:CHRD domain
MKIALIALTVLLTATGSWAANDGEDEKANRLAARLHSHNEVPAVSSPAAGRFRATIDDELQTIDYEFTFGGLQANVLQAHIHFAQPNVNGAIVAWLCGTATNPGPAGTQVCPQSGTLTGTIRPANILQSTTQGIAAGEFDEVVAAIRAGLAYVNVHTAQSPGGEIRGQIRARD